MNENASFAAIVTEFEGPNISLSNLTLVSPSLNRQYGTFTGGTTPAGPGPVVGIEQGVFLTTGSAASMLGPNNTGSISINNGFTYSDPDLIGIASNATRDVVVMTMTAVPQRDRFNIRFVFASDEYPEYVCTQFNDAFGLFLTGPEVPGGPSVTRNIALVPGSSTEIAVNTINSGVVGSASGSPSYPGCELGNSAYYVNNGTGSTPTQHTNLQYDGFTIPISTNAPVVPGETYTIKLAIADAGDPNWDSAVFIDFISSSWDAEADLSLDATIDEANLLLGQQANVTLTVSNAGPDAAANIVVLAPLPTGLSYVSDNSAAAYDPVTGLWTLPAPLASGGSSSITITVASTATGTITYPSQIYQAYADDPNSTPGNGFFNGEDDEASVAVTVVSVAISGRVFEDVNYGGGGGRSFGAASGVGRSGARVELYGTSGGFVASTTTNASGMYSFEVPVGTYTVRVVNSTVSSSRSGYVTGLMPVQTFRTTASTGPAVADVHRVGGEDPLRIDAAANTTSANLASLSTSVTVPQSISPVTVSTANVTGVDFGFNFNTIVNTRNSGQGSLHQFILNSNALANMGLAIMGQAPGKNVSIFMISGPAPVPGLRADLPNQLSVDGVAVINVTSSLPTITASHTVIDGSTQTLNVGNTNSGVLGTGGTVGVDFLPLTQVQRHEVQLSGSSSINIGLDIQANDVTLRYLALVGFGNVPNDNAHANIRIFGGALRALLEHNIIGTPATSFTGSSLPSGSDPCGSRRSNADNVRAIGAPEGILRYNLIGFASGKGFGVEAGSDGWLIEANEFRCNAIGQSNLDGVDLEYSQNGTVRGNLLWQNEGVAVDSYMSAGGHVIVNNTITQNGIGADGNVETPGIRLYGSGSHVEKNVIYENFGAGILVTAGATGNTLTRNSIYHNGSIVNKAGVGPTGQIGIDLLSVADDQNRGTAPFVTLNDPGDADAGGNDLFNYPILEQALMHGGELLLTGFARPGSLLEVFIADADPSGFGEGRTYLYTLIEDSAVDQDSSSGSYGPVAINGIAQGADTTNRFAFRVPLLPGVVEGTLLTATATCLVANGCSSASDGSTSEFSAQISVMSSVITGRVFYDDGFASGVANNALPELGELGLAGVQVSASDGLITVTTVTDGDGHYRLQLPPTMGTIVRVFHSLSPATGSNIAGNDVCLANTFSDVLASERVIGDLNCDGSGSFVAGNSYLGYNFGVVRRSVLLSDQNGQTSSPGVIEYQHIYKPGTLGEVQVDVLNPEFSYQVFVDADCDGTYTGEGPYEVPYSFVVDETWQRQSNGELAGCGMKVRVIVPDGYMEGASDTVDVTVDLKWLTNPNDIMDEQFVTDTTVIVQGGQLSLTKEVRNVSQGTAYGVTGGGAPGEVLEYRINYANLGSDTVTSVSFSDPVPFFSNIELNAYGSNAEVELVCPDGSSQLIATGTVDTVAIDIMVECGVTEILPGESGSVAYQARIQ